MEHPTVDGLRNLGNTCYLNTVLQALASCSSLLEQLQAALQQLEAVSSWYATYNMPASSGAAAEAPLAAALLAVLQQLQPHAAPSRTAAPRQLVDTFRSKLPAGVLEAGEEHDAAEAVEELCRLVAEELQSSFARRLQPQLAARAAVAALLQPNGAGGLSRPDSGAAGSSETPGAGGEAGPACNGHATSPGSEARAAAGGQAADAVQSVTAAEDASPSAPSAAAAAAAEQEAAEACIAGGAALEHHQPDAVLQGWQQHAQLPLHGSTAHELQCLRCRHRSVVQLSPFWVLSLPIPTARGTTLLGNVPAAPGASLEACLASAFAYEALQGWHCTRCSLVASLEAAQPAAAAPGTVAADSAAAAAGAAATAELDRSAAAGSRETEQEPEKEREQQAGGTPAGLPADLRRLQQGLVAGGRLTESETYCRMLADAGLPWLPRPSPTAKRTVAARLPRVLCLQLRRGFWSEHGHVKVAGHVGFPLLLTLPPDLVPRLGQSAPQPAPPADLGALLALQRRTVPRYILRAVVVHHGPLAGAGHYTVFRSLSTAAGSGCSSSSGGKGGGSGVHRSWVRASDESVHPAELREVLEAEASMLVYEACG